MGVPRTLLCSLVVPGAASSLTEIACSLWAAGALCCFTNDCWALLLLFPLPASPALSTSPALEAQGQCLPFLTLASGISTLVSGQHRPVDFGLFSVVQYGDYEQV